MRHLIEKAATVFEMKDGKYIAKKSRHGGLVKDGMYSKDFVNSYASTHEDVLIITE